MEMNNIISDTIQKLSQGWDLLKIYTAIKQSRNPQQLVIDTMKKYGGNNPMINNLISLAESNDTKEIEQFARNICAENGVDYDKEFSKFENKLRNM